MKQRDAEIYRLTEILKDCQAQLPLGQEVICTIYSHL